ncbi:MAG: hypothetical protein OZ948_15685 [Deltaproteobacteria bacterium]|nr:hypothetical protein [Deltaproteobacteria bacterium]
MPLRQGGALRGFELLGSTAGVGVYEEIVASPELQGRVQLVDVVALLSGPERDRYVPGFDASRYIETSHASAYGCSAIASVLDRALGEAERGGLRRAGPRPVEHEPGPRHRRPEREPPRRGRQHVAESEPLASRRRLEAV